MKRKREGPCLTQKRICLPISNKRKFEEQIFEQRKRFFSNKDQYIKQLESCILEMYKKMQEMEYLLQIERQRSYHNDIHV